MKLQTVATRHKFMFVVLMLGLFALPFIIERQSVVQYDAAAVAAGGVVAGTAAVDSSNQRPVIPSHATANAALTTGRSFTGTLIK